MNYTLAATVFACALACSEKKEFKGAVATGQQKKGAEVKPQPQPLPMPKPVATVPPTSPPTPQKPSKPSVIDQVATAPELVDGEQEFPVETTSSKEVDMYWVIDNSGSMAEEAAQVRLNLDKFMKSISTRIDIKVSLLSKSSGQFGAALSSEAKANGHTQIDKDVGSYDPINLLAAAICPAETTVLPTLKEFLEFREKAVWQADLQLGIPGNQKTDSSPFKLCGVTQRYAMEMSDLAGNQYLDSGMTISGAFKPRPNAAQVIVVVTDDDAVTSLPSDNSIEEVLGFGPGSLHLFGFLGMASKPGCMIARRGVWYEKAAAATGGGIFDICEKDWSANFSKLSEQVVAVASSKFQLQARKNLQVTAVLVDGSEIPSSTYKVSGNTISVTNSALLRNAKSIQVKFRYEK